MRNSRGFLLGLVVFGLSLAAGGAASCGGSGTTSTSSGHAGGSTGGGGHTGGGHTGGAGGTTTISIGCSSSADCDGGVCVSGVCCGSAIVCGNACCAPGTVCLFDKCVKPGKSCHTGNDCGEGKYCETALGDQVDGGVSDGGFAEAGPDGAVCTQPLPLEGKCLDLPPVCDPDAGTPGPDAGCVAACEYHPPPGSLNAVAEWKWGTSNAVAFPSKVDIWSTPTVGRIYDGNCDGVVNELDSPVIVVVSGDTESTCCQCNGKSPTACHTGVLRMLDGRTGQEIWSLDQADASHKGFAAISVAIGDVDADGRMDVVAATGDGYVVLVDAGGNVVRISDKPIPSAANDAFGWGGGLAIADVDGDGFPEIAFGATLFVTTNGAVTRQWTGASGAAGGISTSLSTFVDLDDAADHHLELLAGKTAYKVDGSELWNRTDLTDGFSGVGDFNLDGLPEAVLVAGGKVWILKGADGTTLLGPVTLPGTGSGGAPTVADFDGDGKPEIGVAMATYYSVVKPNFTDKKIDVLWKTPNHDLSSSVTGSTVFDFEGDGKAEVIYGDECFLWVFDGKTGGVRFSAPLSSFTATEASMVADVDGDGHAEMILITNSASPKTWGCLDSAGNPVTVNNVKWTPGADVGKSHRGMVVYGDAASSWVGTRTLWNQHTYHVTNICDDRDTACDPPNVYGSIPKHEKKNWTLGWLNNFRQNVQDHGLFDAPDAVVALSVDCSSPVLAHAQVRNIGLSSLPAAVDVGIFKRVGSTDTLVGQGQTTHALFPGQTEEVLVSVDPTQAGSIDQFVAKILLDPSAPKFHECREDNNESDTATAHCVQ